ncbi:hypothetical protein [Clavibacter zhangzhiyongii]|uniref:hypothetical protein n=1 Tax=Clavibacter zhangzhiyongii TaxID=2768071 RepID=UPI0039E1F131
MGILSSSQVSGRPFRLALDASLATVADAMNYSQFDPTATSPSAGWGGVYDDDFAVGFRPGTFFQVGRAVVVAEDDLKPHRLRARFYWMHANTMRKRSQPGDDITDWRTQHVLRAADVLLYEEREGSVTGLVTARDNASFRSATDALGAVALSVSDRVNLTFDTNEELIPEDLFLWLVYLLQGREAISDNLHLSAITELSSKDRNLRPAKFGESATLERVELAALIALGKASFGPAKFALDVSSPSLAADVQLYPDGGFQAFRSSLYDEEPAHFDGTDQALCLFDDIWVRILPELRAAHRADEQWDQRGRAVLRHEALEQVRVLLRFEQ